MEALLNNSNWVFGAENEDCDDDEERSEETNDTGDYRGVDVDTA